MKALIYGGDGMLADTFKDVLAKDKWEIVSCGRDDVDIRTDLARWVLDENKPDWAINCAALTDEDWCESHMQETFQANTWGAINVAKACADTDTPLVHIRSCHEKEIPNNYALAKYLGYRGVKHVWGRRSIIAMTGWLFGSRKDHQFVDIIRESLSNGSNLGITNNNFGTPTSCYDFAKSVVDLMRKQHYGEFTIANEGKVSRWQYAAAICAALGKQNPFHIDNDFKEKAARPYDSSLESTLPSRPYEEALCDYLSQ